MNKCSSQVPAVVLLHGAEVNNPSLVVLTKDHFSVGRTIWAIDQLGEQSWEHGRELVLPHVTNER